MKQALMLLFLALAWAQAQPLADLLPAETFFALGTRNLSSHADKLDPFIQEFDRLELGAALQNLLSSEAGAAETEADAALAGLEGLSALDLLGQDAWIALSASSFNPLPAVTLLARLSPEATSRASSLMAEASAKSGVETLTEGNYTFYQEALENADSMLQVLAYTQVDNLLVLSSSPEAVRAALRQLGGSSDPNFSGSAGYTGTIGQLAEGNFYGYLDFAQVANVLSPFAQNLGFDGLVGRLQAAFTTAGVSAGVTRVVADGIEHDSVQVPDAAGGDAELYALLTSPAPASPATVQFAPDSALSWSSQYTDLSGWWDYLNGLAASTPELGGDLDTLVQQFLGLDLRATLFSWTGTEVTTITTGVGEMAEPGMPSSNLLGESVFAISTTDEAAAQTGLDTLFATLTSLVAGFADPSGGAGGVSATTSDVAGVNVTSYSVTEGIHLSYAVADGQAFIATSPASLTAVLTARAGGATLGDAPAYGVLVDRAPDSASGLTLSNSGASLAATASQITSQLQLTAGLGGAANLDFDAVEAASGKLETFLQFVAERLAYSSGYSERNEGHIHSYSKTEIGW